MTINPDYQTGTKKIGIDLKMTSLMHKLFTILLSGTQSLVTLIVLTAAIMGFLRVVRMVENGSKTSILE